MSITPSPPPGIGAVYLLEETSSLMTKDYYDFARGTDTDLENKAQQIFVNQGQLQAEMRKQGIEVTHRTAEQILMELHQRLNTEIENVCARLPRVAGFYHRIDGRDLHQVISRSTEEVGCAITRCLHSPRQVEGETRYGERLPVACFYSPAVGAEEASF